MGDITHVFSICLPNLSRQVASLIDSNFEADVCGVLHHLIKQFRFADVLASFSITLFA